MSLQRFLCYIQGGRPTGSTKTNPGCSDKTLPLKSESFIIPHKLYFARNSQSWQGGGVAFIRKDKDEHAHTLGRIYLISSQQFNQVVQQENDLDVTPCIKFEETIKKQSLTILPGSWYGRILYLGSYMGYPVMTFTGEHDYLHELSHPSTAYINTIAKGLSECYQYSMNDSLAYIQKYLQ